MLVPLTDPTHVLAALMFDQIIRDKRRELAAAGRDDAEAPARGGRLWSRLATVHKGPNGKRLIRVFRAPAPAI